MSRQIIQREAAQRDLVKHVEHLAQNSPQAARHFLHAAKEAFERLASMPKMGSRCEFRSPAAAGLRFWTIHEFPNHIIIYRPLESGIEVVRVFHAAQNWQTVFES